VSGPAVGHRVGLDLLELPLDELLDELGAASEAPASGSAAALVAAMAAELVAAAARRSVGEWEHGGGAAAQAHALRLRAAPLAVSDAKAYEEALELLRERDAAAKPERRDFLLGRALARAAEVPLLIAEVAADVAAIAREVAEHGAPEAHADAAAAAALAHGAARAAAHLVAVNLSAASDDLRVLSARSLAAAAGAWADAATALDR
jgi:methenyltetrahydrofolate cyclohydrolase